MKRLAIDFLTLFFPLRCDLCGRGRVRQEPYICSSCLVALPRELNYQGKDNNTSARIRGMFPFELGFSYLRFNKGGSVQKLLHMVKYRGKPKLGIQLGKWFATETLYHFKSEFEIIIPVPLHSERLRTRGYNQCLEIARGISEITGNKVLEVLKRERATDTQTLLTRWDRFENTSNEFVVTDAKVIRNKRILLLDDIITTGATMAGSASPLIKEGARLSIAAIALTQDT